jgi:hypothetical protein
MYSNNRISNLISSQLPFFVRNEHPNFILFLEAYYEYLEQSDKTVNVAKNIRTYRDVDLTEDQYAQKLYDTFMKYIPKDVLVDKNLLIKHIKDFYRAKGTEKATKFLMRILYNEEIDFYYPKKDILRASDGKWFIQKSLRITDTKISNVANSIITGLEKYVGTQITGATSNATALVERVDRFFEQGTQIDELIISNINRSFSSGEKIYATFNDIAGTKFISSNVFSGIINTIQITSGGTGYTVGDHVIILSSTGSGACATVASVTTGNVSAITVFDGGAGYRFTDNVSITGGGGSGATANISQIDLTEKYHPNTYNLVSSTISLEANTPLNNTVYSNLSSSNVNTTISNAVSYWTYANTGAVQTIYLLTAGSNYSTKPDVTIIANTVIYSLGILGKMEIVNGGQNYNIGDTIEFINVSGGYGVGALGNVTNVDTAQSNTINEIKFVNMTGHIIGGSGYNEFYLPKANVISSTGNGANIVVRNILGTGANLSAFTSTIGAIQRVVITSRGAGYKPNTTIDLSQSGDGTAQATVSVIEGTYSYPGRYLNDDGHISSYNFLEDRDYYQNFSYVIRSTKSISSYRDTIKNIIHPAGLKLWGEYRYLNEATNTTCPCNASNALVRTSISKTYVKTGNTINISYASHGLTTNSNVTLEFTSGGYSNVRNGIYMITDAQTNFFTVTQKSNVLSITINNAGLLYNTNSYLVITGDGQGANASFTKNANGSIITVTINEPGISYTRVPTVTANGSNSVAATFNVAISYANNTTGNVIVGIYR